MRTAPLAAWIEAHQAAAAASGAPRPTREAVIQLLVMRTNIANEHVSRTTIAMVARGGRLVNAHKANAIARATEGGVSASDLLETDR